MNKVFPLFLESLLKKEYEHLRSNWTEWEAVLEEEARKRKE